jgi:hypothetical protein
MNRFILLLLLSLVCTGCSRPFDGPDIHIRQSSSVPREARWLKDRFGLPDDITDVYYFTSQSLRCNYYLRGRLDKDGVQQYESRFLKPGTEVKELTSIPPGISGSNVAPIKEWWPTTHSQGLRIYEVRNLDVVMLDHETGIVYVALCED